MKRELSFTLMLLLLIAAAGVARHLARAGEREAVPPRRRLAEFPPQLGAWRQVDEQTLSAGAFRELRPDDYLSRTYVDDRGFTVFLSISYYASQRHRQAIHSPQNCLPGAGWTMSDHRLHSLDGAAEARINEYLIAKDNVQMLAFYWYHGRGRIVANEYLGRLRTIRDAMLLGRTDGALVRVIAPLGNGAGAAEQARQSGLGFVRELLPLLPAYIPD